MKNSTPEPGLLPEEGPAPPAERRIHKRCRVEEQATLLLVNPGTQLPCRLESLGLGGCMLHMHSRFVAGILVRVEVIFRACGVTQRIGGVTQWTDGGKTVGIRFVDLNERRRQALAELLVEVEQKSAAEVAEEQAALAAATNPEPEPEETGGMQAPAAEADPSPAAPGLTPTETASTTEPIAHESATVNAEATPAPATPERPRERRTHPRLNVDSSAILHLVDLAAVVKGRIIDLSMGGCLIHTFKRFPLGIFRRIETEFRLHGLPFRLGGVTQTVYDPHRIGIRFLDMSDRKREQLRELIGEVMEHQPESETASENKCGPQRMDAQ